jgi:hypothetical protein
MAWIGFTKDLARWQVNREALWILSLSSMTITQLIRIAVGTGVRSKCEQLDCGLKLQHLLPLALGIPKPFSCLAHQY